MASGVTKEQISAINHEVEAERQRKEALKVNISRLEALPRNVFKYMVEVGEIKGKDLVYLCNTSPILRSHCLANATDINGKVITKEEIYDLALKRLLGKNYNKAMLSFSPSEDYNRLLNCYIVNTIKMIGINVTSTLKDPSPMREISESENFRVELTYNSKVHVTKQNREYRSSYVPTLSIKNLIQVAVSSQAILGLDEDRNLWFSGQVFYNRQEKGQLESNVKITKRFRLKDSNQISDVNIKQILNGPKVFYFLTEEGDLYYIPSFILLKREGSSEMEPINEIYLIEREIKYVKPSPIFDDAYCAIKFDNTIIDVNPKRQEERKIFKLPFDLIPIKVVSTFRNDSRDLKTIASFIDMNNFSYILVLDSEKNLWILRQHKEPQLVDTDVIDMDVCFRYYSVRNDEDNTAFIVKSDGKLYRHRLNSPLPSQEILGVNNVENLMVSNVSTSPNDVLKIYLFKNLDSD